MRLKDRLPALALVALFILEFAGAYPAGATSREMPAGPIYIYNVYGLQNMSEDLNGSYELANDIDASVTAGWNGGSGFVPIGNGTGLWNNTSGSWDFLYDFQGSFEGGWHAISHLYICRTDVDYVGLFGHTSNSARISNVTLTEAAVQGRSTGGCLAGANNGTIVNCSATGSISGYSDSGGLVGVNTGAISYCSYNGSVVGEQSCTGGLAGGNGGSISKCYSAGSVKGKYQSGGLVGGNVFPGSITTSYSTSTVTGMNIIGGLVGDNVNKGIVSDCYSTGSVNGTGTLGGLVGHSNATISNCYSIGPVSGSGDMGGLVGSYYGAQPPETSNWTTNSYWDRQTSGLNDSVGGSGQDTAAMTLNATFVGWDFNAIWNIVEGTSYPFLRAIPSPFYPVVEHSPVWSNIPGDNHLTAGEEYSFTAHATDADSDDELTYGLTEKTQLPVGMSIDPSTGRVNWPSAMLGAYYFNLTATDGMFTIWHLFTLTVDEGDISATNNTVILSPANNSEVSGVVHITVRVNQCRCLGLTHLLVDGAFISNGTYQDNSQNGYEWFYHVWNSSTVQDGRHKITVLGKHQEYSDTIYVTVTNQPPDEVMPMIRAILGPNNTHVNATDNVTFSVDAVDPDGGQLSYEWKENGVILSTRPSFTQVFPSGNHTIVLTIGDGIHYINRTVSFVVSPKPQPKEPEPTVPGFGALAAVAAIAGVVAAGLFWRRERR